MGIASLQVFVEKLFDKHIFFYLIMVWDERLWTRMSAFHGDNIQ